MVNRTLSTVTKSPTLTALGLAALFGFSSVAHASFMTSVTSQDDPDDVNGAAYQAENAFIDRLSAYQREDFEGENFNSIVGQPQEVLTSVGTFKAGDDSQPGTGACIGDCAQPVVVDNDEKESHTSDNAFGGRQNITNPEFDGEENKNWLDSNDISQMEWVFGEQDFLSNAFGFYLMDASDVGAVLEVTFEGSDESEEVLRVDPTQQSGKLWYVSVISELNITGASLFFANLENQETNDGIGIDNATVGVPTPGMLGLMGAGLLAMGATAYRRRNRNDA